MGYSYDIPMIFIWVETDHILGVILCIEKLKLFAIKTIPTDTRDSLKSHEFAFAWYFFNNKIIFKVIIIIFYLLFFVFESFQ